jgi:1-acyl-sn-glycerol-3-phosphate acyltransferase
MTSITNNAWDLESFLIQEFLQLRYIKLPYTTNKNNKCNCHCDSDSDIDNKIDEKMSDIISNGIIITNHRSYADFFIDPYMFQAPALGRMLAVFSILFSGVLGVICNRLLVINRNDSRENIYNKLKKKKIFYFYPEGTRCKHLTLPQDYKDVALKPGLLKSIYEDNDKPNQQIQVVISKNKENVMDEKSFKLGFRKNIIYCVGKPIKTKDYETFEEFFDAIKKEWKYLWDKVYGFDEAKWIEENDEKYDGLYEVTYFPFQL